MSAKNYSFDFGNFSNINKENFLEPNLGFGSKGLGSSVDQEQGEHEGKERERFNNP